MVITLSLCVLYESQNIHRLDFITEAESVDSAVRTGSLYRVFNLKVDRQLSREYFTSDAIYNGSAGMTYTTTCAGVGKTVAGEGRTGLGHPYQLNQSTVSASV